MTDCFTRYSKSPCFDTIAELLEEWFFYHSAGPPPLAHLGKVRIRGIFQASAT
jgi:hypothetical protein